MTKKMSLWFFILILFGCGNSELQFALIGDNPYGDENLLEYEKLIEDINSSNVSWVIHLGDLKTASAVVATKNFFRFMSSTQNSAHLLC